MVVVLALIIGVVLGFVTAALLTAGKIADEEIYIYQLESKLKERDENGSK